MSLLLKKICENKKKELQILKNKCSLPSLIKLLPDKSNRDFKGVLIESKKNKKNNIIAEIKKSSPSAGLLIKDYIPEEIAIEYEKSGAGCISILTEQNYFNGSIDDLSIINKKTNIPLLRKDFIIDPYQIYESKIYKADAILLIVSILNDNQIKDFINISNDIGLDCIIETHNKEELDRAIKINYPIIGINNRNLNNLNIDINNTIELFKHVPSDFTVIAESGIKKHNDIKNYNKKGIYNFLIGETIISSKNINLEFKKLLNK